METREQEKIMIVGVGELGGIVLEYLCRIPGICNIVTADANEDWGIQEDQQCYSRRILYGIIPGHKIPSH